jgi:hypothetical protein
MEAWMSRTLRSFALITSGVLLLFIGLALLPTGKAEAQCGSQASSCKNCHEVQGQDPVNNVGEWHTQHAFGDFCAFCHAGNVQAIDEAAAHAGMVAPLSDINASCVQCHPDDLETKARVYASILGVEVDTSGTGGQPARVAAAPDSNTPSQSAGQPAASAQLGQPKSDADLVDYVQRYNEQVLGKEPTNWGNVILLGLIGVVLVGGGSYVIHNEGLVRISFRDTEPIQGEYPSDIVDMVPDIARLKAPARKSLRRLMQNREAAEALLISLDKFIEGEEKQD